MKEVSKAALLLASLPCALAQQVIITIGIPYCSTNTAPFDYGSMEPASTRSLTSSNPATRATSSVRSSFVSNSSPLSQSSIAQSPWPQSSGSEPSVPPPYDISSPPASETSRSSSSSLTTTPTSYDIPSPSTSTYVDQYGETYNVQTNSGLAGTTIDAAHVYGSRLRRQSVETSEQNFEDCVSSCSLTPACVAVATMGTTCQLFSSVSGSMALLGGLVAFNEERFEGFSEPETPITTGPATTDVAATSSAGSGGLSPTANSAGIASSPPSLLPDTSSASMAISSRRSETNVVQPSSGLPAYSSAWSKTTTLTASGTPSWWIEPPSTTTQVFFTPQPSSSAQVLSSSAPGQASFVATSISASLSSDSNLGTLISDGAIESSAAVVSSSGVASSIAISTVLVSPMPSSESQPSSSPLSEAISSSRDIEPSLSSPIVFPTPVQSSADISSTNSDGSTPTLRPAITCPEQNGTSVTDVNGIQYQLMCNSNTNGDIIYTTEASASFNDCFDYCDRAESCTGFTYAGLQENGEGPGTCYLNSGVVYIMTADVYHIAAIRMSPFISVPSSSNSLSSTSLESSASTVVAMISGSVIAPSAGTGSGTSKISTRVTGMTSDPAASLISGSAATVSSSISSSSVSGLSSLTSSRSSSAALASSSKASTFSPSSSTIAAISTTTARTTTSSTTTSLTTSSTTTSATAISSSHSTTMTSSTSTTISSPTPVPNNGKRGLAYTNATLTLPFSLSGQNSLVSWGYNWYNQRYTDTSLTTNPAIRFIPLLFNDSPQLLSEWPSRAQAALDAGADALMSFNEPDLCGDGTGAACMSISRCVTAYQSHMMPFANQTRLGAPAVTDNGGLEWLQNFMNNCTACHYDFINLHWYGNAYSFSYLQYYVQLAHQKFPAWPIWVTEFGMNSETSLNTDAQTQQFLQDAVRFLDAVPYVERYAWFYDGPGYLINANGSGLNAQGVIYNAFTAPCANWTNTEGHC